MKKHFVNVVIFFLLLSLCVCLAGCEKETCTVTVISYIPKTEGYNIDEWTLNETVEIEVEKNTTIGYIPIKVHSAKTYQFLGWYTDPSYIYQWDTATDLVVGDMTLYAKWEKISK